MTAPDNPSESNRLGSRMRRYAQVSTAVGGLAARLAGNRLRGIGADDARLAAELRGALGGLKGPLMKVAQLLSTIPDALPDDYARELAHLQSNAPRMGWAFVKRRMAGELGADWPQRFAAFEHEAAAAASLGQVHRATAPDGRRLACKLQYPEMASVVEADLSQLKLILGLYRRADKAIDPTNLHAEIAARLREELDYRREARHMALYRRMLDGEAGIHVPEPLPALSTGRLLTMTWLDGQPILSAAEQPLERRNALAATLFRAWYRPFYGYGVIHGDPHLGNYSIGHHDDGEPSLNLLDFGCIRVFPAPFVGGVIDLYHALASDDRALAVHAYETWGFTSLSNELIDVLNIWAGFLYGPLLEDRRRPIQEDQDGGYGRDAATKVHAALRRLGGVTPPREFVLMDRAAIGLGSVFTHLRADLNWHRLFHGLIENFAAAALAERQAAALAEAGL